MKPEVSVVLPTLEEEAIFGVVDDIHRLLGRNTEIIAVARGSDKYFKKLKTRGVRVVYQKVKAVDWAIKQGFSLAKADIIASTDADGTHGSEGFPRALKLIQSGEADFVLGNRMHGIQKGSMSSYLQLGNKAISWIFSKTFNMQIHDVLSGLFMFRKEAYEEIKNEPIYQAGTAFFAIEIAKRGHKVGEVDIKYYPRKFGRSVLTPHKFTYGLGVGYHIVRRALDTHLK